jgi:hypothetical protein
LIFTFLLSRKTYFFKKAKTYSNGGDSACPPVPPLRRAIVLYYLFLGVITLRVNNYCRSVLPPDGQEELSQNEKTNKL